MSEVNTTREAYDISTRRDNSQYTFLLCIQEELKLNKKEFCFFSFPLAAMKNCFSITSNVFANWVEKFFAARGLAALYNQIIREIKFV